MKKFIDILKYLASYKGRIALNLVFNLLNAAFSVVSFSAIVPFLKILFDSVDKEVDPNAVVGSGILDQLNAGFEKYIREEGPMEALFIFCIAIVGLFFVRNIFRYLALHQMAFLRNVAVRDLRREIYQKLLRLPMAYYTDERKGQIMARFTNDVAEVEWSVMGALEALFRQPVMIILYLITLLGISWELTLFVIVVLPITGLMIGLIGKSLKRTAKKGQEELGEVVTSLEETVGGIRIVKGFTAEDVFNRYFNKVNDQHFKLMVRLFRKQYLTSPLGETLSAITIALILWFGGNLVLDGHTLNGEFFILYIVIFSQMISPARALSESFVRVQRGISASERIDEILTADEQVLESNAAESISNFKDQIEFRNVSFKYGDEPVLKNINLTVKRGESIALVGPSGGGKTTLVDLMPRFYDVSEGEILLDGKNIKDFKVYDLRSLFGIVSQQSILFNDSVKNNLLIGNQYASDKQVIDALHAANAHGFAVSLSEGLDTGVGEAGNKLSGGQKQRLSIARAILNDPPIMIMDEATSALDTESERLVQDALEKLTEGRTSFVIAHRLSTVQHADRIIVIDKGEIVEMGNHAELLEKNGLYKRLVDLQDLS
ncbi:ABC transporter ATP-binding protein/permease [Salibacteraceae bacterium]|nr:ABC transporter ATP-binding protein/permease [Salibacteraceae bacterium]MDB9709260.1 ABC transporter ATP-binding protein/permease [Salibacteraceae bacterium]